MAGREQRDCRAEACLARARDEPRIEGLPCAYDVEQQRAHGQIDERERDQGDEVFEQLQSADVATSQLEEEPGDARRTGICERVEPHLARRDAVEEPGGDRPHGGNEPGPPGPEQDHRGDLDGARQPESVRMHRSAQPLAVEILEQPDEDRGSEKQRQGRMPHRGSIGRIAWPA
jgi:hypothetical protein